MSKFEIWIISKFSHEETEGMRVTVYRKQRSGVTQNKVVQLDTGSHEEARVDEMAKQKMVEIKKRFKTLIHWCTRNTNSATRQNLVKMSLSMQYDSTKRRWMISLPDTVGLYWVPGDARVGGNEMADKLARAGSIQKFIRPETPLGSLGRI